MGSSLLRSPLDSSVQMGSKSSRSHPSLPIRAFGPSGAKARAVIAARCPLSFLIGLGGSPGGARREARHVPDQDHLIAAARHQRLAIRRKASQAENFRVP